jgi:tetratricopeptide (TPR) repeat protein
VPDRLRPLWDFGDLDASELRLQEQLAREADDPGRAEVLTQLARVEGLRGDFAAAEGLLAEAETLAGTNALARLRIDLERGRALRSSGREPEALPLFEAAFAAAAGAGEDFIAADAAHMAALVDPRGIAPWTERGIALGRSSAGASYWLGPLLNNLGWAHFEAGEHERALGAFEQALEVRERDPANREAIEIARYAVAKALRALERPAEAAPLLERAAAWADGRGKPDGWFHEELAETYAALGREDAAREQARLALPLLEADDPSFAGERAERLRSLAGSQT